MTKTTQAGVTSSLPRKVSRGTLNKVNWIFKDLKAIHLAWKQALSSNLTEGDLKKQFLLGFIESGVSDLDVIEAAKAKSRASKSPFLPTVGQFTEYCREVVAERIGALDSTVAYSHLVRYYSKPIENREPCELNGVIYHMISQLDFDTYSFKMMDENRSKIYFIEHYAKTIDYLVAGGKLQKPIEPKMRICSGPLGQTTEEERKQGEKALSNLMNINFWS